MTNVIVMLVNGSFVIPATTPIFRQYADSIYGFVRMFRQKKILGHF